MKFPKRLLLAGVALGLSGYALVRYCFPAGTLHCGGYGRASVVQPAVPPQGLVILLASGTPAQRQAAAAPIAATGALVAVVDGDRYLARLRHDGMGCAHA